MSDLQIYPHSLEAERAIIGAILLDNEAAQKALDFLKPEAFYRDTHRIIFESIISLAVEGKDIDPVTLGDHLHGRNELERVGGVASLGAFARDTGTTANLETHCRLVTEKFQLRRLIDASESIRKSASAAALPTEEILEAAEKSIFDVASRRGSKEPVLIGSVLANTFQKIDELIERKGSLTGITTGYPDLDRMTSGFQKSDLIILAARPSMGKTSLALNMMETVAIAAKKPVAFFSLEMGTESVVLRFLSALSRVPFFRIRSGQMNEGEYTELIRAADKLSQVNLFIDDTVGLTPLELRSRCRRLAAAYGDLGMIVVDYLQLMTAGSRIDNRVQEVSMISRMLKGVAREMETPLLCLSQLSRSPESRSDRRPQLSDLRDSGAIEQDADIVAFIHRPDYAGSGGSGESGEAELLIRKHRNGETGSIPLVFLGDIMRFESRGSDDDDNFEMETAVVG